MNSKNIKNKREYGFEYFQGSLEYIISIIAHSVEQYKPSNKQLSKLSPDEYSKTEVTSKLTCKYCNKNKHEIQCNNKNDYVRNIELKLNIDFPINLQMNQCRFCKSILSFKTSLTRHLKTCKAKKKYLTKLEDQLKT